jgi:DNA-binding transcriptional ArsR family regulator
VPYQTGQLDLVFRALADPSRRAIFEQLTRGEAAVKELTGKFAISQPAVSQHLAVLREAKLVDLRHEGRSSFYRIDPRGFRPLVGWMAHYKAFWIDRVTQLQSLLEEIESEDRARP